MRGERGRVPVGMFHGVYDPDVPLPWHYPLWCPIQGFEDHLRYLGRAGYTSLHLDECFPPHGNGNGARALPAKPVVLTFDDAYLDNWVYVFPLLRKYGVKGTIFVPTDFIVDREGLRPTLEDVWAGRVAARELDPAGSVSWQELRAMSDSGLVSVQSHSRSHTWYPRSGRILQFCSPRTPVKYLRFLHWNRYPERKHEYYARFDPTEVPLGTPVFDHHLSLEGRRFLPAPGFEERAIRVVHDAGNGALWDRPDADAELRRALGLGPDEPAPGRPETDAERDARLRDELAGSRVLLEEKIGRPVRYMCWPNGGGCVESVRLLASCGYAGATIPRDPQARDRRWWGSVTRIPRYSATMTFRGRLDGRIPGLTLRVKLEAARGRPVHRAVLRTMGVLRSRILREPPLRSDQTLQQATSSRLAPRALR